MNKLDKPSYEIYKLDDGSYIINNWYPDHEDKKGNKIYAYESQTIKEDTDKKTFESLIYALAEHEDLGYKKYEEGNLKVSWTKKGHKL